MKKVALSLLAFAFAGVSAFAQAAAPAPVVTVGEWGRQIFAIGNQDSSGYWAGTGTSWGNQPRIGLSIGAHTDNYGFIITPDADGGTFGLTDANKAWVSPLPGLTFESGVNLETDTWRGTGDFDSYDWLRLPGEHGDSVTFFRLGEPGAPSMQTDVNYNKDGIGAWALVNQPNNNAIDDLGSNLQAGAAYTIPSVGTIKAQYLGYSVTGTGILEGNNVYGAGTQSPTTGIQSGTFANIQAAFNLSAIANLYEEISVIVPTSTANAGYNVQVADVLTYTIDKVKLHALGIVTSYNGNNNGFSNGVGTEVHGGIDYDAGDAITLDVDGLYINQLEFNSGAGTGGTAPAGFTLGVTKGFGNSLIGLGFEYSTVGWNGGAGVNSSPTANVSNGNPHWLIPLRLEQSF